MEYSKCLGRIITNAACCTCEIKKQAFNKKKFLLKFHLNLRKKLGKYYIWCRVLYGTENWTLWKANQKYL